MNKWIEIFKAGEHTDSKGRKRVWTKEDLAKTVSSYNPAKHEAPAVIGHPKSNGPAFGWVEALKCVGESLMAKLKQVQPDFSEMIEAGLYKKRSASFYPDGSLRHIGFLGAQPPAIKGLKDIEFNEGEECHEYEEPITKEKDMDELAKLKAQLEKAQTALKEANDKADKFEKKATTATASFEESQQAAKKKDVADFIEAGIRDGKILPAWKDQGLAEFMTALEENEGQYEFSEGKEQTPAAFFRDFLEGFSAHPLFKEMAKPADEKTAADTEYEEAEKLADEIAAYVATDSE
ncbi:MAG: hypothetical protein B6I36_02255 [Desulfobacteraceae bacterium 4572_35.1]|nr:MAG: hypothetical protein B6I36_02255 [Desulfobacteraceae bacterium 4572_35.1]